MNDPTTKPPRATAPTTATGTITAYLHSESSSSTQLVGILTLIITGSILLILTGLTLTTIVLTLIFSAPIIILSSPLWLPIATLIFVSVIGFLSFCGFGVVGVAVLSWMYRYYVGYRPVGSDGFDYARSRISMTARDVKVKDVAPSA